MLKAKILVLLFLIVIAASYTRLYNLGVSSFWVDELDFVVAAESMKESGEPLLYSGYAYPRSPLFTYSVMASTALFGVSEFSSRLPSAIFGILAVLAVFWIGKDLFNTRVGLISALLLTISPFAIGWSRTCRMYALFQLLFMVGIYFFYRGFEWRQHGTGDGGSKAFKWLPGKLQSILNEWGIHLPWLLLGGVFLLLSYTTHANAGLFLLTFVAYLLLYGVVDLVKNGARTAFRSKYLVLASVILGLGALSYGLLPAVREFLSYSVFYQPKWAEVATAQNKWRIIEFFMGPQKFPFDWLFWVGAALMLKQKNRAGIFTLLTFLIPVLMFSFVFQYRKNDYIFHVYPIFYLVGAFALDYLVGVAGRLIDRLRSKRIFAGLLAGSLAETLVLALCFLLIPLTFSFRFAQKIPRQSDGHFNGAIYHNEWQEAVTFVQDRVSPQDVLMSTLPLTLRYYLGRAEFNLNWSNGDLAAQNKNYAADGRLIDFYSGADVIEDLDELKKTMRDHPNGWLFVDNYRFDNSVYVPEDVRRYLDQRAVKVFESRNRTVSAYQWTENSYRSGTN